MRLLRSCDRVIIASLLFTLFCGAALWLTAMGIDPWPGTPEELAGLMRTETARYASIIESIGLRLD